MPTVPVVAGNSVRLAPRPVAAVQPVQLDNAIAEGVQHFGAQLGATAETVAQIAENRARLDAKDADVGFSAFGSNALYDPQGGFMSLGGKNALDAFQPTLKQLQDQRDAIESGLKSPLAQQTFRRIADQRIADWQSVMGRHTTAAFQEYQDGVNKAVIDQASSDAVLSYLDPDVSNTHLQTALDEVDKQARQPWNGWSPEQTADAKTAVRSGIRLGIGMRLTQDNPDAGKTYYDRYQDQMTGTDATKLQVAVRVAQDRRAAEERRAAAERRRADAHAISIKREQLATDKANLDTGAGTSADWTQLAAGYDAIGDTSSAAEARAKATETRATEQYRGESLPQLDQRIGDLQAIKSSKGLTPAQASTLNGLVTLRSQTKARLDAPGGALDQFEYATGISPKPLDPTNPATFRERATVAIDAARTYGRPTVEPLRASEVTGLKQLVAGESGQRLQALNEIGQFGDPRAIEGAADQISDKSDGAFRIAATLITLPGNAGEQAARDILRGTDAEKTNPKVFIPASAQLDFSTYALPALRNMPPDYSADVYDAARNLYIARMTQAGGTAWDDNAWRTAIGTVLGGYRHNGQLYGGITVFKGQPVSLPPGWTSDGLFRRLARASGQDWSKATISTAPIWPDGSPVYSGQLRQLVPTRLGGTHYGFMTASGRLLGAKDGGPYMIDVAKVPWQ